MKVKRLVALLEGLCRADPEAQVTFKMIAPDAHAEAQLVDGEVLCNLDIESISSELGTPGGEDTEGNFMDILIYLKCREQYIQDIFDEAAKFSTKYKEVTE